MKDLEEFKKWIGAALFSLLPVKAESQEIDGAKFMAVNFWGVLWGWITSSLAMIKPEWQHICATIPLSAMLSLWCADMLIGVVVSVKLNGIRSLDLAKAEAGAAKLVFLWCPIYYGAFVIRGSHAIGAWGIAGVLETYVLMTILGSIVKNLGRAHNDKNLENAGDAVAAGAGSILGRIGQIFGSKPAVPGAVAAVVAQNAIQVAGEKSLVEEGEGKKETVQGRSVDSKGYVVE